MHFCAELVRDLSTDNRSMESVIANYYEKEQVKVVERKEEETNDVKYGKNGNGNENENGNEKMRMKRNKSYQEADSDHNNDEKMEMEMEEEEEDLLRNENLNNNESKNKKYNNSNYNDNDNLRILSTCPSLPIDGGIDFISRRTLDLWNLYTIVREFGC